MGYIPPVYVPIPGGKEHFTLNLVKGRTNVLEVYCVTRTGAIFDISGLTPVLNGRVSPSSPSVELSLTTGTGITTTSNQGLIVVTFDTVRSASWAWDRLVYEMSLTNVAGNTKYEVISGVVNAREPL